MRKRVEWDWEGQLTAEERALVDAYAEKQTALDRQFDALEAEMEKLSLARGEVIRAASGRARKSGARRVPFKLFPATT